MFEEPVRFFIDVVQQRSARCSISSTATHVRQPGAGQALRHAGADGGRTSGCASTTRRQYGRGGLLPMAVFLTKNAPGLRTSPVKRGYWVVRRLLGETHPAAAAERARAAQRRGEARRPDAARDAGPAPRRHEPAPAATSGSIRSAWSSRATARSARARDEGPRRPAGRHAGDVPRRQRGDRPRRACGATSASSRQDDFVDNLCRKLLAYALGRSLLPVGRAARRRDAARSWRPTATASAAWSRAIVTSPQFLNKRSRGDRRSERDDRSDARSRRASPAAISPAHVPPRRRRDDGAAVAGVDPGLGRDRRGRDGRGRSRSGSPRCSWATASTPTTGGPRAPAPTMELGKSLEPLAPLQDEAQRHQRPVQQARHRRRHPPGQTGNILSGAPLQKGAELQRRHQHGPGARQPHRPGRRVQPSLVLAASSRSPATTRRTSRWPTARTSPGRTPTSPVPMEVYPSLAFDSLFDNRGSQRNQSILDRVQEQAAGLQPAGQRRPTRRSSTST